VSSNESEDSEISQLSESISIKELAERARAIRDSRKEVRTGFTQSEILEKPKESSKPILFSTLLVEKKREQKAEVKMGSRMLHRLQFASN